MASPLSTNVVVSDDIEMEQDDIDMDEEDTEEALTNLEEYDNLAQLTLLKKEIVHMMVHGITPHEGWFDERFKNIRQYAQINWSDLMRKFHGKDEYIHDTALKIIHMCDELVEECSTKPNFHIPTYYRLIHEISNLWQYYQSKYIGAEEDEDVIDLIEGLVHLMKSP